ncbi:kinase suppressor of Ras 2-like [Panonychus citri]|uniref:kinase suppressor of Ras 2-like n=1 Tax=Panonychus citri TaxID=50023 RepID=UPI002307728F|nr:kinase suppressor of Ras 2-like [Panonychus citri]
MIIMASASTYFETPPRSPRTQGCMVHAIQHRFVNAIKVPTTLCNLCDKPMMIGFKCRDCKYRCHRDCVDKVPPSCGLPIKYVDFFRETMRNEARINQQIIIETPPSPNPSSLNLQNSHSMQEWDIPFDELKVGEKIGSGQFSTVYKGRWHGLVAIKTYNMNNSQYEDLKALEAFRQEVATFRKTRHENLVLFMGACMKPPHLAIVTSLCQGLTLYTHIHLRKDKFNLNRIIQIAQQICRGMGYLHARDIVHKDLKSKNICYENGKVIITDFGLCSVTKLCHGKNKSDFLTIPKGWLCYLAPELIRSLRADGDVPQDLEDLPFSPATDIFAFGTVWYELLVGAWPFIGQPPEVIIWQAGKGIKQPLTNLQASSEIKNILMICWSYLPTDRPDFSKLHDLLSKLPRKRLQRSPSHPTYLLRSAESI